jgi:hypothetical protein
VETVQAQVVFFMDVMVRILAWKRKQTFGLKPSFLLSL